MKKILFTLLLFNFAFEVNAINFKNGDKEYILEARDISCTKNMMFDSIDENGNLLFYDELNTGKYYKVNAKNKCEEVGNKEFLDLVNRITSDYTINYVADDGKYLLGIINYDYTMERYIKTNDTEPISGKTYYEIAGDGMASVLNPVNVTNYYELIRVGYPKTYKIEDITYYKEDGMILEKVENPVLDDILSYRIITSPVEQTFGHQILPNVFNDIIGSKSADAYEFDGKYYISVDSEDLTSKDIYDLDGNLLFDNVIHFYFYDNMYITLDENGTNFYNLNKELLYNDSNQIYFMDNNSKKLVGLSYSNGTIYSLSEYTNVIYNDEFNYLYLIIPIILVIGVIFYIVKRSRRV